MNDAFKRYRKSTNIEDRRVERDITKPVLSMSTYPRRDPTTLSPEKVKLDRFRANMSIMEQMLPATGFKAAFKRKRR